MPVVTGFFWSTSGHRFRFVPPPAAVGFRNVSLIGFGRGRRVRPMEMANFISNSAILPIIRPGYMLTVAPSSGVRARKMADFTPKCAMTRLIA